MDSSKIRTFMQLAGQGVQPKLTTGEPKTRALGAQLLLVRDGQPEITPEQGAGTFTIWMRAGMVQRYQVRLKGVLAIKIGLGTKRVTVNQTTLTVIRDVGTTRVEVPAEARRKLGG